MVVVYLLIALGLAFAIAAIVVGREARRLDAEPPRPVFDPDEAVEYVANHLPFDVAAVLSHADVKQILDWNLEFLRLLGVSGNGSGPHFDRPVVVRSPEAVAHVLDKAAEVGADYEASHVQAVLAAQLAYLEAIGAIGPPAPPDDL